MRPIAVALVAVVAAAGCLAPGPVGTQGATPVATGQRPAASPNSGSVGPAVAADWPVYHGDPQRTGVAASFPALGSGLTQAWSATLDGAVYGEPLGVAGQVIVATENDTVYSLDPTSGSVTWHQHLGTPVPLSTLPCGNIDPLGITSTPVYDPSSATVFVVAEITGPAHKLFALDATNGAVRWSRSVDLAGHDPSTHQQRAGLALGNGYVYISFGGLAGDCGQYQGEVVGVPTTGSGATISYQVPVAREGAIWATGGPVIDASGNLYVSVGNGSSTTTYDGSDSVLELSPTLSLLSRFAPSGWAHDNATDADLGSLSPVLVPGGWVFIAGKSGTGYVLKQGALGGIGGEVHSATVLPRIRRRGHRGFDDLRAVLEWPAHGPDRRRRHDHPRLAGELNDGEWASGDRRRRRLERVGLDGQAGCPVGGGRERAWPRSASGPSRTSTRQHSGMGLSLWERFQASSPSRHRCRAHQRLITASARPGSSTPVSGPA